MTPVAAPAFPLTCFEAPFESTHHDLLVAVFNVNAAAHEVPVETQRELSNLFVVTPPLLLVLASVSALLSIVVYVAAGFDDVSKNIEFPYGPDGEKVLAGHLPFAIPVPPPRFVALYDP